MRAPTGQTSAKTMRGSLLLPQGMRGGSGYPAYWPPICYGAFGGFVKSLLFEFGFVCFNLFYLSLSGVAWHGGVACKCTFSASPRRGRTSAHPIPEVAIAGAYSAVHFLIGTGPWGHGHMAGARVIRWVARESAQLAQ